MDNTAASLSYTEGSLLSGNHDFFLFKAAPAAYGSFQAGGRIRAAAAGLHHSHNTTRSLTH